MEAPPLDAGKVWLASRDAVNELREIRTAGTAFPRDRNKGMGGAADPGSAGLPILGIHVAVGFI